MRLTKWQQLQQAKTNRTYWKWKWKREELVAHTHSFPQLICFIRKRVLGSQCKSVGRRRRVRHMMCVVRCFQAHCLRGGHQRVMIYTCLHEQH